MYSFNLHAEGMSGQTKEWASNPGWRRRPEDLEYFARNPTNSGAA
jgi:hypothetical protein